MDSRLSLVGESVMTDEQFDSYTSARQAAVQARYNELKRCRMQLHLDLLEQYTSLCIDNKMENHVTERFVSGFFEIAFS